MFGKRTGTHPTPLCAKWKPFAMLLRTSKSLCMKTLILFLFVLLLPLHSFAAEDDLASIRREMAELKKRVTALEEDNTRLKQQIVVERLVVKKELIVSDTGE